MSSTERLLRHAADYAAGYGAPPDSGRPATGVAVVACMDARLDPAALFGLRPGDAHVIRNAGGIVTEDTLRSLAISQRFLGTTEIVLVHHTRCGLLGLSDEDLESALEAETGRRPSWRAGGFTDLAADVRASMDRIRSDPFVAHTDRVRGFVFDVESGVLEEVDAG